LSPVRAFLQRATLRQPLAWLTAYTIAQSMCAVKCAIVCAMLYAENLCLNARFGLWALARFAFQAGLPP
jgi:hypothetical protein